MDAPLFIEIPLFVTVMFMTEVIHMNCIYISMYSPAHVLQAENIHINLPSLNYHCTTIVGILRYITLFVHHLNILVGSI